MRKRYLSFLLSLIIFLTNFTPAFADSVEVLEPIMNGVESSEEKDNHSSDSVFILNSRDNNGKVIENKESSSNSVSMPNIILEERKEESSSTKANKTSDSEYKEIKPIEEVKPIEKNKKSVEPKKEESSKEKSPVIKEERKDFTEKTIKNPVAEKNESIVNKNNNDVKNSDKLFSATRISLFDEITGKEELEFSDNILNLAVLASNITKPTGGWETYEIGNGWTLGDFAYDGNTVTIFSEQGKEKAKTNKNLVVPSVIPDNSIEEFNNLKPTTTIGSDAFSFDKLTSVVIPDSVTSIGEGAFSSNQLTRIIIPEGVTTIGEWAFSSNQLTNIVIPNSVTTIGESAFRDNKLTSLTIPLSLKIIESDAFIGNPGSNDKHQVFLYTEDGTNPNNLSDSKYHLINPKDWFKYPIGKGWTLGDFTYEGNTVTGFSEQGKEKVKTNKDLILPSVVPEAGVEAFDKLKAVTKIRNGEYNDGAFSNNQLASAVIPDGVTEIGDYAFYSSKLTNVIIPKGVTTIGRYAFCENKLTSVVIPEDVTTIGDGAFSYNQLTSVVIPKGVATIRYGAFRFNKLTSVVIPEGVTKIEENAFQSNQLTNVTISEGVTSIEEYAFSENKLASLNIPLSLKIIKEKAFEDNPGSNGKHQVFLYTEDRTNPNNLPDSEHHLINPKDWFKHEIGKGWVLGDFTYKGNTVTGFSEQGKEKVKANKDLIIPSRVPNNSIEQFDKLKPVTTIGKEAFQRNQLTSVVIPEGVTTIGDSAFHQNQLTSVVIPEGVTTIENSVFSDNQLTSVVIPEGVTTIGDSAFSWNKLTSAVIPEGVTTIGNSAFYNNKLTSVVIPDSVTIIGNWAFGYNQLTSVVVPEGVTTIRRSAFYSNQLTSLSIPLSLKSIESNAFEGNTGSNDEHQVFLYTKDGTNPNNLPDSEFHLINPKDWFKHEIGKGWMLGDFTYEGNAVTGFSVSGREKLKTNKSLVVPSVIPDNSIEEFDKLKPVTTIRSDSFNSKQLTSVVIPNSVTSIGDNAFVNNALTSVVIPDSVTKVGKLAFTRNQLTSVVIPNSVTSIGSDAFSYNKLTSVVIPEGVTTIENYAFESNQLTNVVIPEGVNTIGNGAFRENKLTSVVIPDSVTTIGDWVFSKNKLTSLTIPLSLKSIGNSVFKGNPGANDKHQVFLYTEDGTNPNNLPDSRYHLINPKDWFKHEIGKGWVLGDFTYEGNAVTGFSAQGEEKVKTNKDLVVPSVVPKAGVETFDKLKPVIKIKDSSQWFNGAFAENQLTSVVIPDSVTAIGDYAFCQNKLTKAIIPDSVVTIGNSAFSHNELTSIVIPDSVTTIEYNAFSNNELTSVVIPKGVTTIGNHAFSSNQLTSVVIPEGVTTIGESAFSSNKLTSVVIPDSVITIGEDAFLWNLLTDVVIGNGVKTIGAGAFAGLNHKVFIFGKSPDNQIKNLKLGKSVTTIGEYAFYANQLTSLTIPLSLKNIGYDAFYSNPGSNDKHQVFLYTEDGTNPNNLPDSEYHLINPVFGDDLSLYEFDGETLLGLSEKGKEFIKDNKNKLIIPYKTKDGKFVTKIKENALKGLNTNIVLSDKENKIEFIGNEAFAGNKEVELNLQNFLNLREIGNSAFENAGIKNKVILPKNLEIIGNNAFKNNLIEELEINKNLKVLSEGVFANNLLKFVEIPDNILQISSHAFYRNKLEKARIGSGVESMGEEVFAFNDRYVKIETENPNIKNEIVYRGFGHVVDSINVIVRSIDFETGISLLSDVIIGDDYSDFDGLVFPNTVNVYKPEKIDGYETQEIVKYIPDKDSYVLNIYYKKVDKTPSIELSELRIINVGETLTKDDFLSFVTAKDYKGTDISKNIDVDYSNFKSDTPGLKTVTYFVHDD